MYHPKRPRFHVIFWRKKEIMLFSYARQHALGMAIALTDELAMTLGDEWTIEVIDLYNRVDRMHAIAYERQGIAYGRWKWMR